MELDDTTKEVPIVYVGMGSSFWRDLIFYRLRELPPGVDLVPDVRLGLDYSLNALEGRLVYLLIGPPEWANRVVSEVAGRAIEQFTDEPTTLSMVVADRRVFLRVPTRAAGNAYWALPALGLMLADYVCVREIRSSNYYKYIQLNVKSCLPNIAVEAGGSSPAAVVAVEELWKAKGAELTWVKSFAELVVSAPRPRPSTAEAVAAINAEFEKDGVVACCVADGITRPLAAGTVRC